MLVKSHSIPPEQRVETAWEHWLRVARRLFTLFGAQRYPALRPQELSLLVLGPYLLSSSFLGRSPSASSRLIASTSAFFLVSRSNRGSHYRRANLRWRQKRPSFPLFTMVA